MAKIREIGGGRFERIGAHSHIRGLGLKKMKAQKVADGMVGQIEAREAAGIIVNMVEEGKMAGRAILMAGPPGTGKTAIAIAMTKELGADVPFVMLSGSEIYSEERKKTEILMEAMRKAIGIRIHEMRKIYEGEVKDLDFQMAKNPYNPYQQVPESAKVVLTTSDAEKSFEVGQKVAYGLINQNVSVGDVIMIDAETGRITRVGKSSSAAVKRYEIEAEETIPTPSGDIIKEKEFVYTLTLNNLDTIQAKRSGFGSFVSLFGGREDKEIAPEVRTRVDESVREMVTEGKAEVIPGVLFIDESHMLDIETYSFINRALESELAPIVILASNRGITKIRGTELLSPHGMPLDLLDRLLIINTRSYLPEEIMEILKIRANEERIKIEDEGLEYLTEIGEKTSLRYSVQLLSPASEVAKSSKKEKVGKKDIERVKGLFADVKRSARYVRKHEREFLIGTSDEDLD